MSVDGISSSGGVSEQSMYINKKKRENEELQNDLIVQRGQLERQRKQVISDEHDKTNTDLVALSKQSESILEKSRTQQKTQVQSLNQNAQEHFDKLAKETAQKISELDQTSANQLVKHQQSAMEKVKSFDTKSEDPFYHQKTLNAAIKENDKAYEVAIKLPQHEAQNLFVSIEKNVLKLSLARTFADRAEVDPGHLNRTNSYQTIIESYQLPTQMDSKDMKRNYVDGTLTIHIGKLV